MVWYCCSTRALGPDGFSFGFLKRNQDLVVEDVVAFVTYFNDQPSVSKGCNTFFSQLFLRFVIKI